jgi:acyl transferase domain-containing protein/acyl-CoA synthetase (AMP-forming)/AMP-acid ligase II/NADPH:quinone reductase-like Zn-dependent oxidoreductase/NAD(P)-dependent dehydrogenase (short-subunit alcohol dehydrogenase family)/acyl carrier protein
MQSDPEYGPSLVHVFRRRAAKQPDTLYFRFLHGGDIDGATTEVTWAQHDRESRRIAAKLQSLGALGERVLLLYPPGPEFIAAFSGCLYAGAVAVPTFPPDPGRLTRTLPRLRTIAADSGARFALAPEAVCRMGMSLTDSVLSGGLTGIEWIASDQLAGVDEDDWEMPALQHENLAFLQYTSGSTGSPRGVMVRHGNLLHNLSLIRRCYRLEEGQQGVSWLPVHHDMGLIGGILHGATMTLMSPLDFLRRPLRWLEAITRTRAQISGGPDFAYRLCLSKIRDEELARLDLSNWRLAFSGSEPVRSATLEAFADRFAACGFDRRALYPTYGLAEATLMVSGASAGPRPPVYLDVDSVALEAGRIVPSSCPSASPSGMGRRQTLVGCGPIDPALSVEIVDPETGKRRAAGVVGEIWLRGPSIAAGYWGNEEATRARFRARLADGSHEEYLRTGDLGFVRDGELYITGRQQDLLILRGRNVYPQDLEELAQLAHTRVRPSCVAAFGLELDGEERAVLLAEVDKRGEGFSSEDVIRAIRARIADGAEVELHAVVLVRQGTIPKTTSGKVRRRLCKQMWLAGELEVIAAEQRHAPASTNMPAEPPRDREAAIAVIRSLVAAEIGRPESGVAIDEPLHALGLDSLRLVEITSRVEELFGRPLETLTLFSYPTIEALAGYLVSNEHPHAVPTSRTDAGPYVELAQTCADIERRSTRYQFDLERDVEWDRIDEPGLYIPLAWLRDLGFDVDALAARPDALDLLQWAMALQVCTIFELLEFGVIFFARDEADRLGHTRSVELLAAEEEKHIQLFRRYARHLRAQRPELAEQLTSLAAPGAEALRSVLHETALAQRHYVVWLNFLFFEEYTVHLDKRLRESEGIQPTWRSAHAAHRREEIQHIATDVRYLRALDLDEAERRRISASFVEWLITNFDRQFAIEGARQLLEHVFPGLKVMLARELRAEECLQAFLRDRTFAHSCKAGPFLREATELEPAQLLASAREAANVQASVPEPEPAPGRSEAIAIVGLGCRFPGSANSPDALWQLLLDGIDVITEVPRDRWDIDAWFDPDPAAPNKMYTRWGGFVDHIHDFDHGFFGITPKEVRAMDPQQRMLLEVSWEALEHAGIPPSSLHGSSAGVFVGICSTDFGHRTIVEPIDAYSGTGIVFSVAAGRISYTLGITGPCVAIDTACSSSLVAVHQACRALEGRETDLALAGGVNAILVPKSHVFFSALRAMSPVGRCKSFDASADGYVRSEGCGVVVLKRLADARRDGDRIFAVIRGSAINQDGRSNGLTAPSGLAQEAVMRAALARAGLSPADVDYLEAHGTGTPLGDPIELQAIGAVHRGRPDAIAIGSLKSQIGHSEGAAGIAGLIKAAMIAERGQIPGNLHFRQPTPHVPWSELPLEVVTKLRPLGGRKVIGVNAFGFGGTNAHIVLEPAVPTPSVPCTSERPVHPILVSGHNAKALAENLARVRAALSSFTDAELPDVAHTLACGRDQHPLRVAVLARGVESAAAELLERASSLPDRPASGAARIAFVFTGQGAQYPGMGRMLYETQPSYRAVIDELATYLDPLLDRPLRSVLFDSSQLAPPRAASARNNSLTDTCLAQPAMFAVELALACLWREWGVVPEVVLGHSIGEIAAACFAGVLSMPDAAELVAARGRLMQALPRDGAMFAIVADEQTVRRALAPYGDALAIAAINTATQIVVSGDEAAALELARWLSAEGIEVRRLDVSHAFHSPKMRPMLTEFAAVAEALRYEQPWVPLISGVDRELEVDALRQPQYWVSHVLSTVRFADALDAAAARGVDTLIEIGPRPTLLGIAAKQLGEGPTLLPSLWPPRTDWQVLGESLCKLYERGANIDWRAFDAPYARKRVTLPTYAFMRERAWADEAPSLATGGTTGHPLLGVRLDVAGRDTFELSFSPSSTPWIADHRVVERVVAPATAWLELMRAGAREVTGSAAVALSNVEIRRALLLDEHESRRVQVLVESRDDQLQVEVFSRTPGAGERWVAHARACVRLDVPAQQAVAALPCPAPEQFPSVIDPAEIYAALAAVGLDYGPRFRGLRSVRRGPAGVLAEVALPDGVARWSDGLHPVLLDAALQAVGALEDGPSTTLRLPVAAARFRELGEATSRAAALVSVTRSAAGIVDLRLWDLDGHPLAELLGLELREADPAIFRERQGAQARDTAFRLRWDSAPPHHRDGDLAGRWLIVGEGPLVTALAARLRELADVTQLEPAAVTQEAAVGYRGVIYFVPASHDPARLEPVLAPLLHLARTRSPLLIATQGALAIAAGDVVEASALGAASAWGLGRTIQRESTDCRLLELDPAASLTDSVASVLVELQGDGEDQVAWRAGQRLAARLVPASDGALVLPDSASWRLSQREPGVLDSLELQPIDRARPGPGEVEVAVEAAGLNFRDVLGALGMLPGQPGARSSMGGEFAGRVTAIGLDVTSLDVGDPVMGMAAASFARHVVTDARLVIRRPATLDASAGATIPAAFLTAWYGLYELANLRAGEWCLIHAAAGGVGMAAVRLAQRIGARVIATASPSKWEVVRELGVAHVFNSRVPGWAQSVRDITGGAGVAVVLNSLTGEFIHDSFAALAEHGRFIEMGKAEIWDLAQVREVHASASYQAFDLLALDPNEIQRMLQAIVAALEAGEITPLPRRTFAFTDAPAAFRTMAQARHVGKIVLGSKQPERSLGSDGTWLLTGGFGALGSLIARWLVEHGARHLALCNRGPLDATRQELVRQLEAGGATVRVLEAELSDPKQVESLVAEVVASMPPLRGVVHAAGLLDDAPLAELSWPRFERVLGPKAGAAWALHQATRDLPLDAFVLFSSISGTLGGAGQANYAAANAFLDGLVQHRRAQGQCGVSIAWGPWAGSGMAARLDARAQRRLAEQGLRPIEPELGLLWFARALGFGAAQMIVAPLDLRRLRRQLDTSRVPPLLSVLAPMRAAEAGSSLPDMLAALPPTDRHARLLSVLRERSARVMGAASPEAVDPRTPLRDLGLDSLMGVDLHGELSRAVGRRLDETLLLDHPTLDRLATHLLAVLGLATEHPKLDDTPMSPMTPSQAGVELARELAALEGLL